MHILLLPITGSLIFASILLFLPLTSIPSYESTIAINIFIILFYSYYSYKLLKVDLNEDFYYLNIVSALIIFIVPLILLLISGIIRGFCPGYYGFAFYFVVNLPLLILISSILIMFRGLNIRPYLATIALISIFVISLSLNLYLIISQVQVRFCSLFWGYFSGPIYDEDVSLDEYILLYKGLSLVFSTILILLFSGKRTLSKLTIVAIFILGGILISGQISKYEHSREFISKRLGGVYTTEHFEIIYPPDQEWSKEISIIGELHEYYYSQLISELKITENIKIRSYIFRDEDEKKGLTGAGRTQIAKPWLREIYLTPLLLTDARLKHEISHIVVGNLINSPLGLYGKFGGIIPNMAVIEGISVALEPETNILRLHQKAAILKQENKLPSFSGLFNVGKFYSRSGQISYSTSGSFIKFLIENYGIDKFKRLLKYEDFEKIYNKNISQVEKEYSEFLKQTEVSPQERYWASVISVSKGLVEKRCPHEIANLKKRLIEANKKGISTISDEVSDLIINYCEDDNEISTTLLKRMILKRDFKNSYDFIQKSLKKTSSAHYYSVLVDTYTDLLIYDNKIDEATREIDEILKKLPDSDAKRNFEIKKYIINSKDYELLHDFYSPERVPTSKAGILLKSINNSNNPVSYYLFGRLLFNTRDYKNSQEYLMHFLKLALKENNISKSVIIESANMLLTTSIYTEDFNIGENTIELVDSLITKDTKINGYHTRKYFHLKNFFNYLNKKRVEKK